MTMSNVSWAEVKCPLSPYPSVTGPCPGLGAEEEERDGM